MRNYIRVLCGLLVVALAVSGLWAASAVIFTEQDQVVESPASGLGGDAVIAEMASQSELIVTGRCVDSRSAWIDRSLVTLATVAVEEVIKGGEASTVTVVLPGGADANRRFPVAMTYAGAPQIGTGEEVFLFLVNEDRFAGGYAVAGFSQGKYSIVEGEDGEKLVSSDPTAAKPKSGPGIKRGNIPVAPLSEFKAKVKSLAGQ